MQRQIRIGSHILGDSAPLFIIAEVGVTCNYDFAISKELIDLVKEAGANAAKFIFWFPDELLSDHSATFTYETPDGGKRTENMLEMLSKLTFSIEQWRELKAYADQRGVLLFSTVNTPSGIQFANELELEAFKLSSWDYNYLPLWQEIAKLKKPLLIDTGPVGLLDVAKVLDVVNKAGNEEVVLLHCFKTSNFSEMNMRAIPYMRQAFGTLVGFSAVGQASELDIAAVALGACVIEKRVTISRALPGHHHALAKEPQEFIEYCKMLRDIHASLGNGLLRPSAQDLNERGKNFRRIVANRPLATGSVIGIHDLACKRPLEGGVSPEFIEMFVGRVIKRDIKENEAIQWEDLT